MRQVVTETWTSQENCDIKLSYEFCPALVGKKERQEVVNILPDGRKTVKYWISVANDPVIKNDVVAYDTSSYTRARNEKKILEEKRLKELRILQDKKQERMARYAEMVSRSEEIEFSENDYMDGSMLAYALDKGRRIKYRPSIRTSGPKRRQGKLISDILGKE